MALTKVGPEMGAGWRLIGTSEASTSASLTVTGLDSTYDLYAIVISDMVPDTDSDQLWLRMGDSGGVDSGASDYEYHVQLPNETATTYSAVASNGAAQIRLGSTCGSTAGEGAGGVLYLTRPGDGTTYPMVTGTLNIINQSGNYTGGAVVGARASVITLDRVQVLFSTGNIASGRFSVYGVTHA